MRFRTGLRFAAWLFAFETACDQTSAEVTPPIVASAQPLMAAKLGVRATQRSVPVWIRASLNVAAQRLAELQADQLGDNAGNGLVDSDPDDGGWDWTVSADATSHTDSASPDNIYGATALGPLVAVRAGASSPRLRTALLDAGFGMQSNPAIDSAPDFVYLTLLSELFDNPGFSDLARTRYDASRANAGGAQALAEQTRDARHAADEDGLIPYDLAWRTLGAAALDRVFSNAGYDADADTFAALAGSHATRFTLGGSRCA